MFGSVSKLLRVDQCNHLHNPSYYRTINIKKVHTKALDQSYQRCAASKTTDEVNTNACIATFIGTQTYCRMHMVDLIYLLPVLAHTLTTYGRLIYQLQLMN